MHWVRHLVVAAMLAFNMIVFAAVAAAAEVVGPNILLAGRPTSFTGANIMHVFGGEHSIDMANKTFNLAREFVGSVNHQPIAVADSGGYAVSVDGEWLHPLEGLGLG